MVSLSMDQLLRKVVFTKFFTNGWGPEHQLLQFIKFRRVLGNRLECASRVKDDTPIIIEKVQNRSDHTITSGHFLSPIVHIAEGILPKESENCHFELITPKQWPSSSRQPVCIHLAGTGDHGTLWRRQQLAYPLLKKGIGSIIVENPFYILLFLPSYYCHLCSFC
eukprot:scpid101371/ scgid0895/ Uncharacterized protein C4orf29 homolog